MAGVKLSRHYSDPVKKEDRGCGGRLSNMRIPLDALGEIVSPSWNASGEGGIASQGKESQWHHCAALSLYYKGRDTC